MTPFDIRHLRYFVAVAEELHFGRAAKKLNIAQPPLSQQIRQLEERLGASLLVRSSRKTELTPAGAVLLSHARRLLAAADEAARAVGRAARGELETVRLGFSDSAALSILPDLIRRFTGEQADVHLELSESSTQAQLDALERSDVDLVVVRGPVRHPDFHVETLLSEQLVVALSLDHPLAGRRDVALEELAPLSFVLFPRRLASAFHDDLIALCRSGGFRPVVRSEGAEYLTILSFVAAGLGVSIVPASVQRLGRAGVAFVPLVSAGTSSIVLAWRKDRSSGSMQRLIATARHTAAEYDARRGAA